MNKKLILAILLAITSLMPLFSAEKTINLTERAISSAITLYWDPLSGSGTLEKNNRQISFRVGDDFVLQDKGVILQEKAPFIENNKLVATVSFINSVEQYLKIEKANSAKTNESAKNSSKQSVTTPQDKATGYRVGAILIDPGHGGKDPGASATHVIDGKKVSVVEKDINLSVGLKLYDYLKKAYPDKSILMTRKTDVYVSLEKRTEIANSVKLKENEAILYISIHVNASLDKNASGYEAWYLSPGYTRQVIDSSDYDDKDLASIMNIITQEEYLNESILIAKFVMDGIEAQVGSLSNKRGIKAEEWYVVRNAKMPSVLVETGFLTNEEEARLLSDDSYLQKLSLGIYNGLQSFITHFEMTGGFTGAQ